MTQRRGLLTMLSVPATALALVVAAAVPALSAHHAPSGASVLAQPAPSSVAAPTDPAPSVGTVVDVTTFGADPTGSRDSAPAVRDALRHAKTLTGPVTIKFPRGTYDLYPDQAEKRELYVSNTVGEDPRYKIKNIAILVEDMENVTIDGGGSLLRLHGLQSTFAIIRSKNTQVKNFATDWVAPRTLDLTFVGASTTADGRHVRDVRIPDGYQYEINGRLLNIKAENSPYTKEPYWQYSPMRLNPRPDWTSLDDLYEQLLDLDTGHAFRAAWTLSVEPLHNGLQQIEEVEPGVVRMTYAPSAEPGPLGRVFHIRTWYRDHPGGFIWESQNTTLEGLDVGHLHGFGIIAQFNDGLTVRDVNFRAPNESFRQTVGFADLIQVSGDKGQVLIENSQFGFAHDDPINVHGTYLQLVAKNGRTATFRYMHRETAGFPQFYEGDEVALVDRATMLDLGDWRGRVVSVDGPSGRDSKHDLRQMTVTFDRDLPAEAVPNRVVAENVTYSPQVTIRGCHFESIPTRGILMTTRRPVLIENNIFDQMEMASIYVSADSNNWYESSVVRDFTVRNNLFIRPGIQAHNPQPVIFFEPLAGGTDPAKAAHAGVKIEDNTFLVTDRTVLDAKSVNGLSFKNNKIMRYEDSTPPLLRLAAPTVGVGQRIQAEVNLPSAPRSAFVFRGSNNVELAGNTYGPGILRRVDLQHMGADNVSIADEGVQIRGGDANNRAVYYLSSHPEVAAVNQAGVVVGKQEGTAEISAVIVTPFGHVRTAPVAVQVGPAAAGRELIDFEVVRPNRDHARAEGEALRLVPSGRGSLWNEQNGADNIHLLPQRSLAVGQAVTVKMTGRTQDWYEEAGLIAYLDDDNYVALQRKHNGGNPSITVVNEQGGRGEESRKVVDPAADAVWLRLERTAAGLQGSYSLDGNEFIPIGSVVENTAISDATRLGLLAATRRDNQADNHPFLFTDLRIGDELVPLTREIGSVAPDGSFDPVPLPDLGPSLVADLARAQFTGITMPSDEADLARRDGFVTTAPADVSEYRAAFTPAQAGATVKVRLDGRPLTADADGAYTVPLRRGATVLEAWVTAENQLQQRIYRWTVLSNRPGQVGPQDPAPEPEPTPTPTVEPSPTPTATPEPTATATPTPTPEPSPTPTATATPEPTATPTPTGEPSVPPTTPAPQRLSGTNRVATALAAAQQGNFDSGMAVLVDGKNYADALAASGLAGSLRAPVLLTVGAQLEPEVLAGLQQLGVRRVVVVGGFGSVDAGKDAALRRAGLRIERVAGKNRYETARAVAAKVAEQGQVRYVFVADGTNFADALAAGAYAAAEGGVVLLSDGATLPAPVAADVRRLLPARVIGVGGNATRALAGEGFINGVTATFVAGPNRYATATQLATLLGDGKTGVVLASGVTFPDALAGGAFAAQQRAILLLTGPDRLPAEVGQALTERRGTLEKIWVLGGSGSVSDKVLAGITQAITP
ncbi:cell wall-binding repeat-containing protein [Buchananella hordeovulneris]|uniref:cell wall-binding repeat-containing protein n=1 Tax=Buchananella hordeovulneris TaxID=52770 RepID=UPI00163A001E|nr:cell wall-binding repeat-containing protein [Buchananella hordeovulneris]